MSLSTRMLNRFLEAGRLFAIDLELTYRCQLDCLHCYQKGYRSSELSTGEWLRVLDDAQSMGVFNVGLTGGEVLSRKDFPELLTGVAKRGFRVFVNTTGNGTTENVLEAFATARPARVDVSFYAADPTSHDAVTQRPGSFQESLQFVEKLSGMGLFVRGALTSLQGYSDDVAATRDALLQLGVPRVAFNRFDPTICDDPKGAALLVPDDEDSGALVRAASAVSSPKVADAICGAGLSALLVRPNGTVVPCQRIDTVVGDLTANSLSEIWASSTLLEQYRIRRLSQLPHCRDCPDWSTCGYCPAEAELVSGDWRTPAPGFCHRMESRREEEE